MTKNPPNFYQNQIY